MRDQDDGGSHDFVIPVKAGIQAQAGFYREFLGSSYPRNGFVSIWDVTLKIIEKF